MKSWQAWLCTDCDEIFKTITIYGQCPSCMSSAIQPLSVYVKPTMTQKERHEVLTYTKRVNEPDPVKHNICKRALAKIRNAAREENISVKKQTDPEYH